MGTATRVSPLKVIGFIAFLWGHWWLSPFCLYVTEMIISIALTGVNAVEMIISVALTGANVNKMIISIALTPANVIEMIISGLRTTVLIKETFIFELLKDVRNQGTAIVIATHDMSLADSLSAEVLRLEKENL